MIKSAIAAKISHCNTTILSIRQPSSTVGRLTGHYSAASRVGAASAAWYSAMRRSSSGRKWRISP